MRMRRYDAVSLRAPSVASGNPAQRDEALFRAPAMTLFWRNGDASNLSLLLIGLAVVAGIIGAA